VKSFDSEKNIEHEIEILSDQILAALTNLNKRVELLFPKEFKDFPQRIDEEIVYPPGESAASFSIRKNIQRVLAEKINHLTHLFRMNQHSFLERLLFLPSEFTFSFFSSLGVKQTPGSLSSSHYSLFDDDETGDPSTGDVPAPYTKVG
jgi:hypothetical protein